MSELTGWMPAPESEVAVGDATARRAPDGKIAALVYPWEARTNGVLTGSYWHWEVTGAGRGDLPVEVGRAGAEAAADVELSALGQ